MYCCYCSLPLLSSTNNWAIHYIVSSVVLLCSSVVVLACKWRIVNIFLYVFCFVSFSLIVFGFSFLFLVLLLLICTMRANECFIILFLLNSRIIIVDALFNCSRRHVKRLDCCIGTTPHIAYSGDGVWACKSSYLTNDERFVL